MAKCGQPCEVYSRVTGYHRPLKNWNKGKQEEFRERKLYDAAKGAPAKEQELCLKTA